MAQKFAPYLFETCLQNMKYLLQVLFLYNFKLKKVARLRNFGYFCSKKEQI